MDQEEIRMRYGFAMTAFARMYGVPTVNSSANIHKFCHKWAESGAPSPEGSLVSVNFYFKEMWDIWGEQ